MGALIASSLTEEALHQWGWRIPFVMGGLIAVVGWYVRTRVPESPAFETIRLQEGSHHPPSATCSPRIDLPSQKSSASCGCTAWRSTYYTSI